MKNIVNTKGAVCAISIEDKSLELHLQLNETVSFSIPFKMQV
jgi:hypothetical protein